MAAATPPPWRRQARATAARCDFGHNARGIIGATARLMPRLLDPKLDVTFKKMFADEQNRDVLISLLTAVLRPANPIVDVAVISPEIPVGAPDDKGILLDVLVRLSDGSLVDVEMQTQSQPGAKARALYHDKLVRHVFSRKENAVGAPRRNSLGCARRSASSAGPALAAAQTIAPVARAALLMGDGKDVQLVPLVEEHDCVRKAVQQNAPDRQLRSDLGDRDAVQGAFAKAGHGVVDLR